MNFEIVGIFPANRGAMLMLEAICEQVRLRFADARLAVSGPGWTHDQAKELGLWLTAGSKPRRCRRTWLLERAPAGMRHWFGHLAKEEIDVVLDASGFGYGDFWGLAKLRDRLADRLEGRGKVKSILLPQALGPFRKPEMATTFLRALDQLDLAFVRDDISMGYVDEVAADRMNVRRAPDFTNLLQPVFSERSKGRSNLALLVPNEKMIAQKSNEIREMYFSFLTQAIDAIRRSGREATILLHEGDKDRALAETLNSRITKPVEIIDEVSPLETKAIIANAELLISSRFHGLVSGLSSAIPSIACGWSHKYRELMKDYGCEDMVVSLDAPTQWNDAFDRLIAQASDGEEIQRLRELALCEKKKSKAMWEKVFEVIDE